MAANFNSVQRCPKKTLGLAISAACAGVPAAQAQEIIEEIIVTSTKREANVQDIPMSVTVLTDEAIVRQGFKQLDDYVGQIPALSMARREPYGTNVIMRGCAVSGIAFADTATTAVYLDEQPITVAGVNPDPRLVDIQRVEALSGPQGTLFGDASQCGTLRILTNKPDTNEFDSWVELTGMAVEHGDTGYDFSGMVNIPMANNKLALRLVGFYAEEPGYVDNVLGVSPSGVVENEDGDIIFPGGTFDNSEFAKADINKTTVSGGRATLRWSPGDNWAIDLGGIYQKSEADGFGDTDLAEDGFAGASVGEWEQLRFGNDVWEDEWYQFALTAEGSLGWGDLTIAASFMNRKASYDADSTAYLSAWQEFYPYYNIYDFGGDPQAMSFDVSDQDRYSLEVRLATPADSDSRWSGVVGAFYNKSDDHTHFSANVKQYAENTNAFYYNNTYAFYYNTLYFGPSAPTSKWWDGVYNTELEQVAVFGEVGFDITDWFNLTGGWPLVRHSIRIARWRTAPWWQRAPPSPFRVRKLTVIRCPDPPHALVETEEKCWTGARNLAGADESGFVPKITTTFNITDDKMFYLTYSEGFRRGGGNAARPASVFGRPPLDTYDSDLVKNYEGGLEDGLV